MQYDSRLRAYIDPETGDVIPVQEGDELPQTTAQSRLRPSQQLIQKSKKPEPTSSSTSTSTKYEQVGQNPDTLSGEEREKEEQMRKDRELALAIERNEQKLDGVDAPGPFDAIVGANNGNFTESYHDDVHHVSSHHGDDANLAYYLQMLEFDHGFEIPDDGDFTDKEVRASSFRRQMFTISTFICVIQVVVMIVILGMAGFAPVSENPMFGPSGEELVKWQAKQASLIVYKNQWWRLVTPIFLHAGLIHLFCNVFIQLRVGGYLELVFGRLAWCTIYFLSGIFGNILSCIFLSNNVGVGSSGSLLGILTAWAVWIVFRWRKIPDRYHRQRNCQFFIVVFSIAITLATSAAPYVDWAAHAGGVIQGLLWGGVMLSKELDNVRNKWIVRIFFLSLSAASFAWSLYYVAVDLDPNPIYVDLFEENDW